MKKQNPVWYKQYYQKNREKMRAKSLKWRADNLESSKEQQRLYYKSLSEERRRYNREKARKCYRLHAEKYRLSHRLYAKTHRKEVQASHAKTKQKLREMWFKAYGGKCSCCGDAHKEFMSIQHVNRDGKAHRTEVGGGGIGMYWHLKKLGWPKDKYTMFCMNCNFATRYGAPCPHVRD